MNVTRFSCFSFKRVRSITTKEDSYNQKKLVFGSASKKGFRPLSLSSVPKNKSESWDDKNRMIILNVDQLLEGLTELEIIHTVHHNRYDKE